MAPEEHRCGVFGHHHLWVDRARESEAARVLVREEWR